LYPTWVVALIDIKKLKLDFCVTLIKHPEA
jgi:hypothetical protein